MDRRGVPGRRAAIAGAAAAERVRVGVAHAAGAAAPRVRGRAGVGLAGAAALAGCSRSRRPRGVLLRQGGRARAARPATPDRGAVKGRWRRERIAVLARGLSSCSARAGAAFPALVGLGAVAGSTRSDRESASISRGTCTVPAARDPRRPRRVTAVGCGSGRRRARPRPTWACGQLVGRARVDDGRASPTRCASCSVVLPPRRDVASRPAASSRGHLPRRGPASHRHHALRADHAPALRGAATRGGCRAAPRAYSPTCCAVLGLLALGARSARVSASTIAGAAADLAAGWLHRSPPGASSTERHGYRVAAGRRRCSPIGSCAGCGARARSNPRANDARVPCSAPALAGACAAVPARPCRPLSPSWGLGNDALALAGVLALARFARRRRTGTPPAGSRLMGASRHLTFAVFTEAMFLLVACWSLPAGGSTHLRRMSARHRAQTSDEPRTRVPGWRSRSSCLPRPAANRRQPGHPPRADDGPRGPAARVRRPRPRVPPVGGRGAALARAPARRSVFPPHGGFRRARDLVALRRALARARPDRDHAAKMRILLVRRLLSAGAAVALLGIVAWLVETA